MPNYVTFTTIAIQKSVGLCRNFPQFFFNRACSIRCDDELE